MANTRFFLDERCAKSGNPGVLKVAIAHKKRTALISLDAKIFPNQWDRKKLRVVNHPDQLLMNVYINTVKQQIDSCILSLAKDGKLVSMGVSEIKSYIEDCLHPERLEAKEDAERKAKSFSTRFLKFADSKKPSTRGVYMQTYRRLIAFDGDHLEQLRFEDITKDWLVAFDNFMAQTAPSRNARNIHLRNICPVFNEAIVHEITMLYPFRCFNIRSEETIKRNLKVEELCTLFDFPAVEHARKYINIFKLQFMLIGINTVDLCNLKEVEDGDFRAHDELFILKHYGITDNFVIPFIK